MDKRTKKSLSVDAALLRLRKYCAFTERSLEEIKKKMKNYNLSADDAKIVIERLTKQGFIDENRFATSFAGGKFRIKKWGKGKIKNEMRKKGISDELIEKGLKEVPEKEYKETLDELLQKKWKQLTKTGKEEDDYAARQNKRARVVRFAAQKGYEIDIIMDRMRKMGI